MAANDPKKSPQKGQGPRLADLIKKDPGQIVPDLSRPFGNVRPYVERAALAVRARNVAHKKRAKQR